MKIELVTGGTTFEACKNTIKKIDFKDFEKQNLVVVPDSFSMQAESLIFDVLDIDSTLNIEVVGISRLANKILRNNDISFQRLTALEEIFSIFKVVKQNESQFKHFKKCDVDFCIKLLQIIKQFKACKIAPERLVKVDDKNLDDKMQDLKLIYQDYQTELADRLDLSKLLDFFLEKSENELDLSKINLFFVNFDSFSSEINSFICRLAKSVNKIYIGCAKSISPLNAFIYEDDIMQKTIAFAKENSVSVQVEDNPTSLSNQHLTMAKNLFALEVEPGQSDFFVNLISKNKKEEIEFVAKIIKNQVFHGKKFNNFAVAVANKNYFEPIKKIFESYDIAFYCDDALTLNQTVLGRFLIKMLEMGKLELNKDCFKYICLHPLTSDKSSEDVLKKIDYLNVDNEQEFLEVFPQAKPLLDNIKVLKNCKSLEDYIKILQTVLVLVKENFENFLTVLSNKDQQKYSENAQSFELVTKTLDKLNALGGKQNFDLNDFQSLLQLAFETVKVETVPSLLDGVFVGDATDSYFEDVDMLFVLGATSALPRTRADNGIIDDDDIKKLRINFALEPEIRVINRRNRLKLFELLQHAQNKLIISTPANEDGKPSIKASFIDDLYKMFGKNVFYTDSIENLNLAVLSEEQKMEMLLFNIGSKQNLRKVFSSLKSKEKLPKKYIANFNGLLDEAKKLELNDDNLKLSAQNVFSASQLENFFVCPFKHFLNYKFKLKEKEDIEPTKKQFGTFQHALLQEFVKSFDNLKTLTEKDVGEFLKRNLMKIAGVIYHQKVLRREYFVGYLNNESKIILKNVLKERKNSDFKPFLLEEKIFFALDEKYRLVGYVDRVDKSGDYFRIIDYKTGKTSGLKKDLFYGKKLQLFLYGQAIAQKTGLSCGGVYYFDCNTKYSKFDKNGCLLLGLTKKDNEVVLKSDYRLEEENFKSDLIALSKKKNVKDGEFAFKSLSVQENFDKLFEYSKKISLQAIKLIEEGFLESKPIKDACNFCPYLAICKHSDLDGYRTTDKIGDDDFK